jgi:3-phenylpropionate/cinnamic acid dioxygenase small subunit
MAGPSMEDLADKDAIRELLARYCYHLDNDRFEEMAALFAPDGIWETAFGTATGHLGIVAQARGIAVGPRPRRVHLTTNIVITLNGDTATVGSNWTLVQNSPNGPVIGSGGAYDDHLVKRGGHWFFQRRTIDRFIAEGRN